MYELLLGLGWLGGIVVCSHTLGMNELMDNKGYFGGVENWEISDHRTLIITIISMSASRHLAGLWGDKLFIDITIVSNSY